MGTNPPLVLLLPSPLVSASGDAVVSLVVSGTDWVVPLDASAEDVASAALDCNVPSSPHATEPNATQRTRTHARIGSS